MKQNKVLVGLSGGVDSAVSCALLKKKGYAVSAAFLCFWDGEGRTKKALVDAKKVCAVLDIPLEIIDLSSIFKKTVIKYFIDEYAKGKTPNPCVFCNEKMKFKLLLSTAEKKGIKMVATGHYAKIKKSKIGDAVVCKLFPAVDQKKDQSYFLYRLGQEVLSRTVFPLGGYKKEEVRELAKKFGLPVFDKGDSQDVCFMANGNLEEFLRKKINLKKGKIINTEGHVLGEHKGLPLYTIGQRKGINVGGTGPYFVISKDIKKNILTVTNDLDHPAITQKTIKLGKVAWTSDVVQDFPLPVIVRTRYHNPLVCAIIEKNQKAKKYQLIFDVSQKAVSPGQSVVFYSKDGEVLGGGIIR